MLKKICLSFFILLSFAVWAQDSSENTIPPTPGSKPLPSLKTTNNIDTVLTERVQAKIKNTQALVGQSVSAASRNQIITLEGTVETKAQENTAIAVAKSVKGVKGVKSQITIK